MKEKALWGGAMSCLPGDLVVCGITTIVGTKMVPLLKRNQLAQ